MINYIMKRIALLVLVVCTSAFAKAQQIEWISWEEAEQKLREEPRKVVVDVYTEWCGWCKKMDAQTFHNPEIVSMINENYYAIKFDAEYREVIKINGEEYKYIRNGKRGYNELAAHILRGKLSYPSIVFLDESLEVIQPIPGFRDPITFNMILSYFDGDYHKSVPWKVYSENYPKKKLMPERNTKLPVQAVGNKH